MATPAELAQDNRVAEVMLAIDTAGRLPIHFAPVAVITADAPSRPVIGFTVDGRRFVLSRADAVILARVMRMRAEAALDYLAGALWQNIGCADLLALQGDLRRAIGPCPAGARP